MVITRGCTSCEYAYARFKIKDPGYSCEIEDLGIIVPKTLNESKSCLYWERKGTTKKKDGLIKLLGLNGGSIPKC